MSHVIASEADLLEFTVLHTVKIRGFATAEQVCESSGSPLEVITTSLDQATSNGELKYRSGRITGFMVTGAGRSRHAELRSIAVGPEQVAALSSAYDAFLKPNAEFKQLTTDWQIGPDKTGILPRLSSIHTDVRGVLELATVAVPRFSHYQPRFDRALAAFSAGDESALAKPMAGSYHDVWMELHEDLLVMLGRERTEEDG